MKIIKFIIKIIIFIVICISKRVYNSIEPLMLNDVYMNQMKNISSSYAIINLYPYLKYGFYLIIIFVLALIVIDLIDLVKNNKKENK